MELRQYQQEAHDAFWASLLGGKGHPLIDMPTGSGKSPTMAAIARTAVEKYAGQVVIVAHRKELLRQTADKLQAMCPTIPVGIYSAGLKSRQTEQPILVCGIQSVYERAHELSRRHLCLIDEAHLIPFSDGTMYRQFLSELEAYNPKLKLGGLTATPWRLDGGQLWGKKELFSHVAYRADIRQLISDGYLSNLVSQPSSTQYDTSGLHIRGGEFITREMVDLFADAALARDACLELIAATSDRKSILVFCAGVSHAEVVQEILESATGERVDLVTGETQALLRASSLEDFNQGLFRFLVSIDVLTTGFDSPRIDCVALMRSTASSGLYCQMVGRGLRIFPGKADCVVLDFGNNIRRHGPIDAVGFGSKPSGDGTGEAPEKTCPGCDSAVAAGLRTCECGFRFPAPQPKHDAEADLDTPILSQPEMFVVNETFYALNKGKEGKKDTLRVHYDCHRDGEDGNLATETINEWVCIEHPFGYAKTKAKEWWKKFSAFNMPDTIAEALELINRGGLADCRAIEARRDGRWWRVLRHVVGDKPDELTPIEEWEEEDSEVPF